MTKELEKEEETTLQKFVRAMKEPEKEIKQEEEKEKPTKIEEELKKEVKTLKAELSASKRKWDLDEQRRFLEVAKLYAETQLLVHALNKESINLRFDLANDLLPIGLGVNALVVHQN